LLEGIDTRVKQGHLWQVGLDVPVDQAEEASRLLSAFFGVPACIYTAAEAATAEVSVYLEEPVGWNDATEKRLRSMLIRRKRKWWQKCLFARLIKREDWAESWKKHFHPLRIGSALLIRPSWSQARPVAGQKEMILDPGLSFGTGQHPTTWYCLRQLVSARRVGRRQAFLDAGTGSGVLAIAAALLGYQPVWAVDYDVEAVRAARANMRLNKVQERIKLMRGDLTAWPAAGRRRFDVICANLTADILIQCMPQLFGRLNPGGKLVVAGILAIQFKEVADCCRDFGLELAHHQTNRGWRSATFVFPPAKKFCRKF